MTECIKYKHAFVCVCITCVGVSSQVGQLLDGKQQLFRLSVVGQKELCPGSVTVCAHTKNKLKMWPHLKASRLQFEISPYTHSAAVVEEVLNHLLQ